MHQVRYIHEKDIAKICEGASLHLLDTLAFLDHCPDVCIVQLMFMSNSLYSRPTIYMHCLPSASISIPYPCTSPNITSPQREPDI